LKSVATRDPETSLVLFTSTPPPPPQAGPSDGTWPKSHAHNKRYFVLHTRHLSYYTDSTAYQMKGLCHLADMLEPVAVTSAKWLQTPDQSQSYVLDGVRPMKVFYFAVQCRCRVFLLAASKPEVTNSSNPKP
jgi:hypothetical protein